MSYELYSHSVIPGLDHQANVPFVRMVRKGWKVEGRQILLDADTSEWFRRGKPHDALFKKYGAPQIDFSEWPHPKEYEDLFVYFVNVHCPVMIAQLGSSAIHEETTFRLENLIYDNNKNGLSIDIGMWFLCFVSINQANKGAMHTDPTRSDIFWSHYVEFLKDLLQAQAALKNYAGPIQDLVLEEYKKFQEKDLPSRREFVNRLVNSWTVNYKQIGHSQVTNAIERLNRIGEEVFFVEKGTKGSGDD
jgi:hypothetical protein